MKFLTLFIFFVSTYCSADEFSVGFAARNIPVSAEVSAEVSPGSDLQLKIQPVKVFYRIENKKVKFIAQMSGQYSKKGVTVFHENSKLKPNEVFTVFLELKSPFTQADFVVVNAFGFLIHHYVRIDFPKYYEWLADLQKKANIEPTPWRFAMGVGVTYLNYQQTGLANYTAFALTPKFSLTYVFAYNWSVALNGFGNTLLVGASPANVDLRFMGANLRVGFTAIDHPDDWKLSLNGGYYYTTTFATNNNYGYIGMNGIQIFPTFQKRFGESGLLSAYLKFSLLMNGLSVLSLANNEIAAGASWTFDPNAENPWSVTFDFSTLYFELSGVEIRTQSYSLGAAYSL